MIPGKKNAIILEHKMFFGLDKHEDILVILINRRKVG